MILINLKDKILFKEDLILQIDESEYDFSYEEVSRISILTTERRLLKTTVFLVFTINSEQYIMPLTHPDFQQVLTYELGDHYDIDYSNVIMAMNCKEDREFTIYKRRIIEDEA